MKYSFADKKFEAVEEMCCSRCRGYTKKPFAKLLLDGDEFIFCDSDCLENWVREYREKAIAIIVAEGAFDALVINSIAANYS